jgi:hypothetical protein
LLSTFVRLVPIDLCLVLWVLKKNAPKKSKSAPLQHALKSAVASQM